MNRPISASLLYSHLSCPHRVAMDAFGDPDRRDPVSPFVQMLWERGTIFERDLVAALDVEFVDLSDLGRDAKETATREAIGRKAPLIYGGRLAVGELLGEPDLLRLEGDRYVAIDIKSGAGEEGADEATGEGGRLKKTYGVQLALYTDLLERLGVSAGRYGYIWDIHGDEVRYDLDVPLGSANTSIEQIYRRARAEATATLDRSATTLPAAAGICKQCVWRSECLRVLKASDDLTLLPELGRARRDRLAAQWAGVADLAAANVDRFIHGRQTDFQGVGAGMLRKFQARAALASTPGAKPYLTAPVRWPAAAVELFFDIETDPMRNLCYLHGFVIREHGDTAGERFEGIFAEEASRAAEKAAFAEAMAVFRRYPDAIVVHYSKYERTHYRLLQKKYEDVATAEEIEALFAPGRALDLYFDVVKPSSEWPTMDFSIKSIAKVCGFAWRDSDPSGASSIEWFDRWAKSGDPTFRTRLLEYNEDDCKAMRIVLDAMKTFEVRA